VMMGRTHGVHAEPLTLGIKLANFVDEVRRARARLAAATAEIAVGQITGAVGTHASVPPELEEHVCQGLGLATAPVATQVLARDRHASFVTALALLGAVLERLATTIPLLQITEGAEVEQEAGVAVTALRAPYGAASLATLAYARRRGLTVAGWTRWGWDWRAAVTADSIAAAATRSLSGGEVILLHDSDAYCARDSWRATAAAVPLICAQLERVGLVAAPFRDVTATLGA